MASRADQAKRLKMKRRFRYAVFSGSTVKHLRGDREITVEYLEHEGEDKVRVVSKPVFVGVESFSKQTINTGRGPDAERMAQYYAAVNPKSFKIKTLSDTFGDIKDPRYAKVWQETPVTNKINLISDGMGRLDLFWHGRVWFFVELDYTRKTIRRSRDYGSKDFAKSCALTGNIQWELEIPAIV